MAARKTYQDKAHWQQLVDRQKLSGFSGAEFCRQENVRYASFMGWRKRLRVTKTQPGSVTPSTFVELTAPASTSQNAQGKMKADSELCVELSLGAGVELRITRRR